MIDARALADQFRRSVRGNAWHGPALLELLADVNAEAAVRRTIPSAHNIWEILLHLTFWAELGLGALQGKGLPPEGNDWPEVGVQDESQWKTLMDRFRSATDALAAGMAQFPDGGLGGTVPGRTYRFDFLMQGLTQHNLYHAGQIAILKKS